jgi:hypothetical protein
MIRDLTQSSLHNYTQTFVAEGSWGSSETCVEVSFLPGISLLVNARSFTPTFPMRTIKKDPETLVLYAQESIPLGIFGANSRRMAQGFNKRLDNIVESLPVDLTAGLG